LLRDTEGNLFGTTSEGGAVGSQLCLLGCGVVFEVDEKGNETVLYTFTGGADGSHPAASLVRDSNGNFYGTTELGGTVNDLCPSGCGVVFKLDSAGKETVLHSFTGGKDGSEPYAGLLLDSNGNFYGTTLGGGKVTEACPSGCGVVFELPSKGELSVLHSFTAGKDGAGPAGNLVMNNGILYGTTLFGGNSGCGEDTCGVVFEVTSSRKETVLHRFTYAEGSNPIAGLTLDSTTGNFYGTTSGGGASCNIEGECGAVFKIAP
jgi:uncharacterized repeat protein (TIGR03803 family)